MNIFRRSRRTALNVGALHTLLEVRRGASTIDVDHIHHEMLHQAVEIALVRVLRRDQDEAVFE